jgi:hypothetical protein
MSRGEVKEGVKKDGGGIKGLIGEDVGVRENRR